MSKIDLSHKPDLRAACFGVIDAIMTGDESIDSLCGTWQMSTSTFYKSVLKDPALKEEMAIARKVRAQRYADQALEASMPTNADWRLDTYNRYSANTGLIQRDALRAKTLLHLAAKLDPEQFGDRIIEDHRGEEGATLVIGDTTRAAELIRKAREARLAPPEDANVIEATSQSPKGTPQSVVTGTENASGPAPSPSKPGKST